MASISLSKNIGAIDFGPLDARHAATHGQFDEELFSRVFIDPSGIDLQEMARGRKPFIYGIKGSGKSAALKYLEISLRKNCECRFVYFSDTTREATATTTHNVEIPASELLQMKSPDEYWRSFVYVLIAKMMYEGKGSRSSRYLEFIRRQSTSAPGSFFERLRKAAPTVSHWAGELGRAPKAKIEGGTSTIITAEEFFADALSILSETRLPRKFYLFIDEVEIAFHSKEQFNRDVALGESLVRTIRDLNESFRKRNIDVFVCCAVRKELSDRILGGDSSKIISDLGQEVSWQRPSWTYEDQDYIHPLFQIALRRIYFSQNSPQKVFGRDQELAAIQQYFPFYTNGGPGTKGTQGQMLDLTTYRPRDISILFGAAKNFDRDRAEFRRETFFRLIRKPLKDALWRDFSEALRAEFSVQQISILSRILDKLPERFEFSDFLMAVDDFSSDPTVAAMIDNSSDADWAEILRMLYTFGAVGNVEPGERIEERYKFHFRGYTNGLLIARGIQIVKQKALVEA